jgi:bacterioferritin-associated ferredoxin
LRVTEDVIRDAVAAFDIQTIHELRAHTGAGDGCTACHSRLEEFLEAYGRVRLAADSCSAAR